jgi:archaellum component FlaF (FlaF/FlaG flagellin family)
VRNFKRSKRGQATAIGAVLFLALAILMIAFAQEVYFTQSNMNQLDVERIQENIVINSAYTDSLNHLVVNMTNRGASTANIVRLWIVNQTDNQHYTIAISNLYLEPGASSSYVTSERLTQRQDYSIRIVTERGNIASYNIVPQIRARIDIYAPATNLIGNNATVLLTITNNDTSGNNMYNVIPVCYCWKDLL